MKKIYSVEYLKDVSSQIIDWNYESIKGTGVFAKLEKYAHIEISIRTTEYYTDEIIWNVKEEFIPIEFHQEISEVLTFFGNYLSALKGRREKNLAFEITDGSFNFDSGRHSFMFATVRALVSCFDKKIFEVSLMQRERIIHAKKNGLDTIKEWAKYFSEEKIIESLQDVALTSHIRSFLNKDDLLKLKLTLHLSQAQDILGNRFLSDSTLIEKNIITKYGDLSRIGLAHIALIANNKAVFPHIGVFRMDLIRDKFV